MRTRNQLMIFSVLLLGLFSCSKDNDSDPAPAPPARIEGLWIGTYAANGNPGSSENYFSYAIKPGGKVTNETEADGAQNICLGNWTLNGTTLVCSYECVYGGTLNVGVKQTGTLTWDKGNKLTGTYQNTFGDASSGTLTLTKVE